MTAVRQGALDGAWNSKYVEPLHAGKATRRQRVTVLCGFDD